MFKKNPKTKQFDMFSSPSGLLCEREGRLYYGFRRKLCKHEEKFKENLFDKCFKQITKQQALSFFVEDAAKIVYRTDSETMGKCLLTLGIVIDYILKKEHVDKAEVRRNVESIPFKERKKRNNVEAFMLQYGFHIRNNKTEYRKLFKYGLQAIVRCAWIVFSGLTTN